MYVKNTLISNEFNYSKNNMDTCPYCIITMLKYTTHHTIHNII